MQEVIIERLAARASHPPCRSAHAVVAFASFATREEAQIAPFVILNRQSGEAFLTGSAPADIVPRMNTDASCIFCRIASGEIPSRRVHEDPEIVAFEDVNPQAPVHVLVVPRAHIPTLNDLDPTAAALAGRIVMVGREVARKKGLGERGYRLVLNCLEEAGQSVFHIHLHVLGGRPMGWPPG